jgi:hypothetical protein
MGLFNQSYKNRMKFMGKPFSHSHPFGATQPADIAKEQEKVFSPPRLTETVSQQRPASSTGINSNLFMKLGKPPKLITAGTTKINVIETPASNHQPNKIVNLKEFNDYIARSKSPRREIEKMLSTAGGKTIILGPSLRSTQQVPVLTKTVTEDRSRQLSRDKKLQPPSGGLTIPSATANSRNGMVVGPMPRSQEPNRDGYLQRERARKMMDNSKKITWEALEKLGDAELRGLTNIEFDPGELIGPQSEHDKKTIEEYQLGLGSRMDTKPKSRSRMAVEDKLKDLISPTTRARGYTAGDPRVATSKERQRAHEINKDNNDKAGGVVLF